jgi:hypothetical protein
MEYNLHRHNLRCSFYDICIKLPPLFRECVLWLPEFCARKKVFYKFWLPFLSSITNLACFTTQQSFREFVPESCVSAVIKTGEKNIYRNCNYALTNSLPRHYGFFACEITGFSPSVVYWYTGIVTGGFKNVNTISFNVT